MALTDSNNNDNNMTSTPFQNWREFFSNEEKNSEYGTFDHFDDFAEKYVGDTNEFKTLVKENNLETIIIFPGSEGTIRLLHNCSVCDDNNKLIGIYGMTKFATAKEISINALTKAMAPSTPSTRSADDLMIPSEDDFKECNSGDDFRELVGTSETPVSEISKMPQSFWIHPHVVSSYVNDRQVKISDIVDLFATILEEMEDTHASDLTKQYYEFLVFLWSVSKGFATWNPKLTDPDEKAAEGLLEVSSEKLSKGDTPSTNTENTRTDRTQGGNQGVRFGNDRVRSEDRNSEGRDRRSSDRTRRNRSSSPNRRGTGSRNRNSPRTNSPSHSRPRRRGRRNSRSQSRSNSRERPRGRRNSRSRSPPPRAHRGSRSRSPPPREHRNDSNDLLHQLTRSVSTLAYAQNERLKKESAEKSALGKLSERQKDLFLLLSARDWHDRNPRLNRSVEALLQSRQPEKQWNLVLDWSRRWPGMVSKQGMIQFLSSGYSSRTLPGGFTVFMFSPIKKLAWDKKDRKRNIKGTFGRDGVLDDEAIEFYATLDYHMPSTPHEAETQLELAIMMLEKLTGHASIATDGYVRGLDFLNRNRLQIHTEMEKDKMFMARYLHFLDVVFNTFCDDLADYHDYDDPIGSAKRRLRGRMKDDIDRVLRDLVHGITPSLPLPEILEEETKPPSSSGKPIETDKKPEGERPPPWWSRNPGVVPEWKLPERKSMKDLFTNLSPKGKENVQMFPKTKHHDPKVTETRPLCIKYQCQGRCRAGCALAHLRPGSMGKDVRSKTDEAFKHAYA
jgi:hypothetical protein